MSLERLEDFMRINESSVLVWYEPEWEDTIDWFIGGPREPERFFVGVWIDSCDELVAGAYVGSGASIEDASVGLFEHIDSIESWFYALPEDEQELYLKDVEEDRKKYSSIEEWKKGEWV